MDDLIKRLEELKTSYEKMRGSQKMGVASHWWDGRAQGIKDVLELICKQEPTNNSLK